MIPLKSDRLLRPDSSGLKNRKNARFSGELLNKKDNHIMQVKFKSQKWLPYVLLSPSIIVIAIFFIIPSIQSLYYSFFRVNATGTRKIFVGFLNFTRLFRDPEYLNSMVLSLVFAFFVVIVGLLISIYIARVANRRYRGFDIYRIFLIWPYALSPAIAGMIWALMFNPTIGVSTHILSMFGITFEYVSNGFHAMVFITVTAIWKMMGYNIIFTLAGLQSVPTEIVEAAIIDGASKGKAFWKVIFPVISPTIFFLFVMNTLYAFFQQFGLIHVATGGGPGRSTDLLVYKLYRDGFIAMNTGGASAQSIILLIFVSIVMTIQFKFTQKSVFYGA